jgi:hypothetical protein
LKRSDKIYFLFLVIFILVMAGSFVSASDSTKGLEIKHAIFFETKKIEVRETYGSPTPYAPYPNPYGQNTRIEYEYFINSAAEIKNPTDKPISADVTCEFRDKMARTLRTDGKKVKLEPGGSIRMIFRSGLKAEEHGPQALSGEIFLSDDDQKDFLAGQKDLNFEKNKVVACKVLLTVTEVSCRFKAK